jgi:pimeloyl-ACP methyl ester carboxylesterase
MTDTPSDQGAQPADIGGAVPGAGFMPFRNGRTWYRVAGTGGLGTREHGSDESTEETLPLLVLHGGPGGGHEYLLPLADLLGGERALVFYDQVGCGESTPRPDWPDESFTVGLFVEELEALVQHLGLRRFHLIGHSWGGMLAAEYALGHPDQLASLTLCSTTASVKLMMGSLLPLYAALAAEGVAPEQFMDVYCARHICRITPLPEALVRSLAMIAENPQINQAMVAADENGEVIGTLRGWSCEDRLSGISMPALVMHGEFDELNASTHQPFLDLIPDVRGHVFPGASHTAYLESPKEFRETLGSFLAASEGKDIH